jgi:hypothetical protein
MNHPDGRVQGPLEAVKQSQAGVVNLSLNIIRIVVNLHLFYPGPAESNHAQCRKR